MAWRERPCRIVGDVAAEVGEVARQQLAEDGARAADVEHTPLRQADQPSRGQSKPRVRGPIAGSFLFPIVGTGRERHAESFSRSSDECKVAGHRMKAARMRVIASRVLSRLGLAGNSKP